jgi:hypothetical protein
MEKALGAQPIDRALRIPFEFFGGLDQTGQWQPGLRVYNKAGDIITNARFDDDGRFSFMNPLLHTVRAGMIDRYGLDPAYVARDRERGQQERRILAQVPEILAAWENAGVKPEEMAALQAVLTGEEVGDERWQAVAAPVREAIDQMGQQAVELGLVSAEVVERNRGKYLHRSYMKHEAGASGLAKFVGQMLSGRRRRIIGNQFKGRGIFLEVPQGTLLRKTGFDKAERGDAVKGERFQVLDLLDSDQGTLEGLEGTTPPKIRERVYLPAGQAVPAEYAAYTSRGEWEVRGTKNGKVVLWRDFTKEERTKMGEIVDARFTVAKTFMLMAHDLATGRFFKDIALNPAWSQAEQPAPGTWLDGAQYGFRKQMSAPSDISWVRVPETVIKDSNTKRYGQLAGRYVRADIWRDMQQLEALQNPNTWDRVLRQWKLNKTARSPVVHMNNVMSNFILMDMADVRATDLVEGIKQMLNKGPIYQQAMDHGAFGTDMVAAEIRQNTLQPILDRLAQASQQGQDDAMFDTRWKVLDLLLNHTAAHLGPVGRGLARVVNPAGRGIKRADEAMLKAYQMEDEVFRMALMVRRIGQGVAPELAATEAREQFIDYDIRAPWVNAARRSVLPFASYTYRAAPMLAKTLATRPWKIAKYATLAYMFGALAYALMGEDDDDEERQRRSMREQEQGRTWMGVPRMMRMPYNHTYDDESKNPVFLDIRRWMPAGDIFDMGQGQSVLPLPGFLQAGGPLLLGAEMYFNQSAFTGKKIVNHDIDTAGDVASKTADYLYKAWMPSAAYIPGSWYWGAVGNAMKGARDNAGHPLSLGETLASSVGVKLKTQDVNDGLQRYAREFETIEKEIKAEMFRDRMDLKRGIINEDELNARTSRNVLKLDALSKRREEVLTDKKKPPE